MISRVKLAKFSAKLVANFRRSLEGDFRASFAGENRQKHFPQQNSTANFTMKLHLRGSGLWWALHMVDHRIGTLTPLFSVACPPSEQLL